MTGTFMVIFVGGGSIVLSEKYPHLFPPLCVPFAWGFVVCMMIVAVGRISGAHFNPAVTLAFAAAKRFPTAQVLVYWLSQFCGGLAAIRLLAVLQKV
jgi:aquaporin NIP